MNAGQDSPGDLQVFVDAFQISFPLLLDVGTTYTAYRQSGAVSPFPLDYVIDRNGNVAYFSTEYEPEKMVQVIDTLLANPVRRWQFVAGKFAGLVSVLSLNVVLMFAALGMIMSPEWHSAGQPMTRKPAERLRRTASGRGWR